MNWVLLVAIGFWVVVCLGLLYVFSRATQAAILQRAEAYELTQKYTNELKGVIRLRRQMETRVGEIASLKAMTLAELGENRKVVSLDGFGVVVFELRRKDGMHYASIPDLQIESAAVDRTDALS